MRKLIDREHTVSKLKRAVHAQDKAISVLCQLLLKIKKENRLTIDEEQALNKFPENIPLCLCIPDEQSEAVDDIQEGGVRKDELHRSMGSVKEMKKSYNSTYKSSQL